MFPLDLPRIQFTIGLPRHPILLRLSIVTDVVVAWVLAAFVVCCCFCFCDGAFLIAFLANPSTAAVGVGSSLMPCMLADSSAADIEGQCQCPATIYP